LVIKPVCLSIVLDYFVLIAQEALNISLQACKNETKFFSFIPPKHAIDFAQDTLEY